MNNAQPTTKLYDLESTTMGMSEQISVVLPPGYDSSESLPLLIRLHGGGEDRAELDEVVPEGPQPLLQQADRPAG